MVHSIEHSAAILNEKLNLVGQTVESQGNQINNLISTIKLLAQQNGTLVNTINRIENLLRAPTNKTNNSKTNKDKTTTPPQSTTNPTPKKLRGKGKKPCTITLLVR